MKRIIVTLLSAIAFSNVAYSQIVLDFENSIRVQTSIGFGLTGNLSSSSLLPYSDSVSDSQSDPTFGSASATGSLNSDFSSNTFSSVGSLDILRTDPNNTGTQGASGILRHIGTITLNQETIVNISASSTGSATADSLLNIARFSNIISYSAEGPDMYSYSDIWTAGTYTFDLQFSDSVQHSINFIANPAFTFIMTFAPVPEPSTTILLAGGLVFVFAALRKRNSVEQGAAANP